MGDLKIDPPTGDLAISNGNLTLTDDSNGETVAQRVSIRLKMFLGEWFLDTRLGMDFFGQVLVKNPDLAAIEAIVKSTILDTPEVLQIISYSQSLDRASRQLSVTASIQDDAGNILPVEENLGL